MAERINAIDAPASDDRELARWLGLRYAAKADFEGLLNERQNEILGLSQRAGPKSDAYQSQKDELDRAKREFDKIGTAVRRPLNKWRLPASLLIGVGLFLAAFEAPVNKFLFDVALRSTNLMSWGISFVFACALLGLAHFAGVSLRHIWSDRHKRPVLGSILIFLLMFFVLFVLVSILTIARASFSASAGTIGEMFADVTASVTSAGLFGTLVGAFSDIAAVVLATINVGGIFMTMMLAFFTHDSDKDFDAASRAVDRARKRLEKLGAVYIKGKDEIVRKFSLHISETGSEFKSANQHVIELKRLLGQPLEGDDHLVIDSTDRLAEDSRYGEDIDNPFTQGPDGEVHRADGSTVVRAGPAFTGRKSA